MDFSSKMDPRSLSWDNVHRMAANLAEQIKWKKEVMGHPVCYPIPRGGIYAAQALKVCVPELIISEVPQAADFYIDDVIDSGETRKRYIKARKIPFYALIDKKKEGLIGEENWVSFPWERMNEDNGPQDNIRRILQYIGEDPNREGLKDTPNRVVASYDELFSGYKFKTTEDIAEEMTTFVDGTCKEMVIVKGLSFTSMCEHHMMPFYGTASISYLPQGKIVGLSKLARLLEVFARRLQVQERMTTQITDALDTILEPKGSACVVEATHSCMCWRGVKKEATTITSSLTGEFLNSPSTRAEFFSLIRSK